MGYARDSGYVPTSIDTIMGYIMAAINTQFELSPAYTMETFVGTNAYKYFYALAQKYQENEVKTSEIFTKLQAYFDLINARISRPVVTNPGIVEKLGLEGYVASVKPMIEADAGKINICIDVDDGVHAVGTITVTSYANLVSGTDDKVTIGVTDFTAQTGAVTPGDGTFRAATGNDETAASLAAQINAHAVASLIVRARAVGAVVTVMALQGGTDGNSIVLTYTDNDTNVGATVSGSGTLADGEDNAEYPALKTALVTLISQITVGGAVTQGLEAEAVVFPNGQSFDFKYHLPNKWPTLLKLTTVLSENNQVLIGSPEDVKQLLLTNVQARYRLGRNFEPQRYFSLVDAPWAASVLLEYSIDGGGTYQSTIYESNFDDLFEIGLADITLVET